MNDRQEAVQRLRPRWGTAFCSVFLFLASFLLPVLLEWGLGAVLALPPAMETEGIRPQLQMSAARLLLTVLGLFLSLFLAGPISLGRAAWYRALSLDGTAPKRLLLLGFRGWRFWQAVALRLIVRIKSLCWSVLFFTPAMAVLAVAFWLRAGWPQLTIRDTPIFLSLLCIAAGLGIIGQIACGIFLLRYVAAEYYLIDSSAPCGVWEAVGRSVHLMKGKRFALTRLLLSLFPWWIACLALSPLIFVLPYFWETRALFLLEHIRQERLTERMTQP